MKTGISVALRRINSLPARREGQRVYSHMEHEQQQPSAGPQPDSTT